VEQVSEREVYIVEVCAVGWIVKERWLLNALPESEMPVQADLITASAAELAVAVEPRSEVVIELRSEVVSRIRAECSSKQCSKADLKYTHGNEYFLPVSLAHILVNAVAKIQRISTSVRMISTRTLYY
jgi:hypothetical protein